MIQDIVPWINLSAVHGIHEADGDRITSAGWAENYCRPRDDARSLSYKEMPPNISSTSTQLLETKPIHARSSRDCNICCIYTSTEHTSLGFF